MKILVAHNFYREPGGEDAVFAEECRLLRNKGHQVITYKRSNEETVQYSVGQRIGLLKTMISAGDSRLEIERILRAEKPDVVHVHNTFMMISPSIFDACVEAGVPSLLTLHNYRLLCPAVTLCRDGHVCEECITHGLTRSVLHGCYRGSRIATVPVAVMLQAHRVQRTWTTKVNGYIALTEFAKTKFAENGLPRERIHVKPNFVDPDPGQRVEIDDYVFFAGRLTAEKGVSVLVDAWARQQPSQILMIAGDGPERVPLQQRAEAAGLNNVKFLGRCDREEVRRLMARAKFVMLPSLWYEGFPMVLVESFACGVPVIGSRLGAMAEVIRDGVNGLNFMPGDAEDLAEKISWALDHPAAMIEMGAAARRSFEENYSADRNYESLMNIYSHAMEECLV